MCFDYSANVSTHRSRKLPVLPGLPGFQTSNTHASGKVPPGTDTGRSEYCQCHTCSQIRTIIFVCMPHVCLVVCDARGGNCTGTGCSGQGLHWHWECGVCAYTGTTLDTSATGYLQQGTILALGV